LAELAAAVPADLGVSEAVRITQEMVDTHADTTGDAQWIHNDPERAVRESPFGGPVAQGFLLMSLLTRLSSGLSFPAYGPVGMLVNYGFDRVRFLRPVPVGASVALRGTLAEVRPREDGSAVLAVDVELHLQGDEVGPVAIARWLFLAVPTAEG
jgi:acyl dehydratase